jgi:hypothetical protein
MSTKTPDDPFLKMSKTKRRAIRLLAKKPRVISHKPTGGNIPVSTGEFLLREGLAEQIKPAQSGNRRIQITSDGLKLYHGR